MGKFNETNEALLDGKQGTQPIILIVEDDPVTLRFYQVISEQWPVKKVIIAKNGHEALAQYTPGINLVLLDIGLPGIDGIEVCEILRHKNPGVPIVIISAHVDMSNQMLACESAGANEILIKPLLSESIKKMVDTWLNSKKILIIQERFKENRLYAQFGKIGYQLVASDAKNIKNCYQVYRDKNLATSPFEAVIIVEESNGHTTQAQETTYYQAIRQQLSQWISKEKNPLIMACDQAGLEKMQKHLEVGTFIRDDMACPLDLTTLKILLNHHSGINAHEK